MSEVKEETQLSFHDLMEINRENIYRERLMVYAKIENARLLRAWGLPARRQDTDG